MISRKRSQLYCQMVLLVAAGCGGSVEKPVENKAYATVESLTIDGTPFEEAVLVAGSKVIVAGRISFPEGAIDEDTGAVRHLVTVVFNEQSGRAMTGSEPTLLKVEEGLGDSEVVFSGPVTIPDSKGGYAFRVSHGDPTGAIAQSKPGVLTPIFFEPVELK